MQLFIQLANQKLAHQQNTKDSPRDLRGICLLSKSGIWNPCFKHIIHSTYNQVTTPHCLASWIKHPQVPSIAGTSTLKHHKITSHASFFPTEVDTVPKNFVFETLRETTAVRGSWNWRETLGDLGRNQQLKQGHWSHEKAKHEGWGVGVTAKKQCKTQKQSGRSAPAAPSSGGQQGLIHIPGMVFGLHCRFPLGE